MRLRRLDGEPPAAARRIAIGALLVAIMALVASAAVASAGRDRDTRAAQRVAARSALATRLERDTRDAPLARSGRCTRPTPIRGTGRACRTSDGLLAIPRAGGVLLTHGPDLVAAGRTRSRSGGFGTPASILCSAPGSTRHVVLAYLLPANFASGAADVHGDRSVEVADQLRQALYDAAALVDRTAGELAPGARRRLRVACDASGQPRVERIVLPRTALGYRNDGDGGFDGIERDLAALGVLDQHPGNATSRLRALRRVLAYYDADFHDGIAGQGVLWRRSSLLVQGVRADDPLLSKTSRNVSNNPPRSSLSIQYGTSVDGRPDPPLYTALLHELAHAMGAVQDEPPTSTRAGHCTDGLDVMCYDDGGPRGRSYSEDRCPDPTPADESAADERFDCNGDTYFHPAPPPGSPLAAANTWNLALPANETLSTSTRGAPPLAAPTGASAAGRGTAITVRWNPVAGATGYDLAWRLPGQPWRSTHAQSPRLQPSLPPATRVEFEVAAHDARGAVGPVASLVRRTGPDTTPPTRPGRPVAESRSRTALVLRFAASTDNVAVVRYLVERREGRRWVRAATVGVPRGSRSNAVVSRLRGLARSASHRLRVRAVDARGNQSTPSGVANLRTRS